MSGTTAYSLQHPNVNFVFSGSYWSTTQGQQDEAGMLSEAQAIMSSGYLSALTQYGSDGVANVGSHWNDPTTVASNPSTAAPMQTFLQRSITNHNAAPGSNDWQHVPIFVVVSDPTSSAGSNSGWNGPGNYVQNVAIGPFHFQFNENIRMIWLSTETDSSTHISKDGFTDLFSHELAESMAPAIVMTPPSSLPSNVKGDSQISDNEPDGARYTYRLGGNLVQAYWSNNDGAFIVPDGNSETFYMDSNWTGTSFNGNFNLRVQGDQLGVNFRTTSARTPSARTRP